MPKIGVMKTLDSINYFGSAAKLAHALGIKQPSVSEWGEYPPGLRQLQIERLTDGELKAEENCFDTKRDITKA